MNKWLKKKEKDKQRKKEKRKQVEDTCIVVV